MPVRAGPALAGLAAPGLHPEFARSLLAIDTTVARMFPDQQGAGPAARNPRHNNQLQISKISGITNSASCV